MDKIALVTDSTAYIPNELIKAHHITVVPLILIWEEKSYRDGVDIQPGEVYTRLKTAKTIPTTSQAPIAAMQIVFQELINQGFDVLGLFLSAKLSGTIQSAIKARGSRIRRRKSSHPGQQRHGHGNGFSRVSRSARRRTRRQYE